MRQLLSKLGRGWLIGRAVASDTRGPRFELCKLLYGTFVYCQLHRKDENQRKKEAGNGPFKKLVEISNR